MLMHAIVSLLAFIIPWQLWLANTSRVCQYSIDKFKVRISGMVISE